MKYLSVCSGIEAVTQAWHPLGWKPAAFSEIEKFPAAVLDHHYPWIENLGDMTQFKGWPDYEIDLLVGGTPCQSFSVAGLRAGLEDPRGNLALTFCAIADRYRPKWVVWENVPGVLSADKGRAFGSILGALAELGYGWAYRILDAQYVRTRGFPGAVPQRRRRVFVVAYLGDWRRAAAVLFDPESLSGNPPPGREAGEETAHSTTSGALERGAPSEVGREAEPARAVAFDMRGREGGAMPEGPHDTANIRAASGGSSRSYVAHALRGEGFDASEDDTGRGTPLAPEVATPVLSGVPNGGAGHGARSGHAKDGTLVPECANPLTHRMHKGINTTLDEGQTPIPVAYGFNWQNAGGYGSANEGLGITEEGTGPLQRCQTPAAATPMAVRRLTPRECERLQGFPDNFTRIPWRGKPAEQCPDGPRYKALGNSMAVNCMEWLGERIQVVDQLGDSIL